MFLIINTKDEENYVSCIDNQGREIARSNLETSFNQTDELLPSIENMLQGISSKNREIQAIFVNTEALSYTSVRVGVATANALAFALNIPVYELRKIYDIANQKIGDNFENFLSPVYSHPPKITKKKL